jgi:hypothetical protein
MLSLIVPPIILVLALALLVYFMSRRLPVLQARIRRGEVRIDGEQRPAWQVRLQHTLLGVLEKLSRRFKVTLLRAHNSVNGVTDSLRTKREASRERLSKITEERKRLEPEMHMPEAVTPAHEQAPVSEVFPVEVEEAVAPAVLEPVLPEISRSSRAVPASPLSRRSRAPLVRRPLRETRPQEGELASKPKEQLEELLIERIVSNPRDIEAYERLGDYYLERESYVDAKECYRQVLKLSPVNRMVKIKIRRLERILEKR